MSAIVVTWGDGPTDGRCLAVSDGYTAEMTYSRAGAARLIIDQTGAPDALREQGAGKAPVRRAVEDARAAGVETIPLYTFARAQTGKHPDWQDVLA